MLSNPIQSVHDTANLNRMSVIRVGNLDTVARITSMDHKSVSDIHCHMVDPASIAVEE